MGDVINLRRARKDKARGEKEKQAEANRLQFGRTKAERKLTDARNELAGKKLDDHKLGDP